MAALLHGSHPWQRLRKLPFQGRSPQFRASVLLDEVEKVHLSVRKGNLEAGACKALGIMMRCTTLHVLELL